MKQDTKQTNGQKTEIEKAFEDVTGIIFGKGLPNLHEYKKWLVRDNEATVETAKSSESGREIYIPGVDFFRLMKNNLVDLDESIKLGNLRMEERNLDSLGVNNASKLLNGITTTTSQIIYGENIGSEKCACYGPTQNCYESAFCWFSKTAAYCYMPRTSEYIFGCSNVIDVIFSIKCYNSAKLTRCFEVSDSNNCTDCYFCHNCENLRDSMFCFNARGKQYSIANIEVGKEKYLEIKKMIINSIVSELEKTKKLRYGIYALD